MGAWRSIGQGVSRRTAAVLAVVVLLSAVAMIGLTQLEFSTGQDSYIDSSSQVAKDNEQYQSLFGGENMVVLLTAAEGKSVVDVLTADTIAQLNEIEQALATDPSIESIVSPVALLTWSQDLITSGVASEILARTIEREPDVGAQQKRRDDAMITTLRLGGAGEQSFDNPEWTRFLVFGNDGFTLGADGGVVAPPDDQLVVRTALRAFIPDARHAVFAAVLQGNASLDDLAAGSEAVQAAFAGRTFTDTSVTVTGTPTFLTDINDYLQGGMLTLGGIAVLVMIVILVVAFGVRWRLLPLVGMVVGVVWGFGAFGFSGTPLSLVTIAGLPILIGLGIEFAIQVQNRIEEERDVDRTPSPFGETLAQLGPALVVATIAAVIAFLTVKISKVPMVQDFGVLLSIGIVALLIAGILLPTTVIGLRERKSPTTKPATAGWVEKVVDRLGSLPHWTVIPLVVVAVAIPILGLTLEGGSRIESDPVNWADPSSAAIVNARTLERETGFASTLGVFVQTDNAASNGVFTDQMGAFVFGLVQRSLGENVELAEASSLASTVGWLAEVPGTTSLPPTGLDMLQAYRIAPASLQAQMVGADGNSTQVLFQVGPSSLEERAVVLDRVEAAIAAPSTSSASGDLGKLPAAATATTGGLAVVGVGLLENITANRAELTIVAILLVGAFLVLRSRDLARGLLTMVPVMLAVGTSAVLVRALGITLSPLTTVGGPLVVATCAEFSVLLMARYAEERARGLDPQASTDVAAERTGRAFFTSALTTLGGFAVLMFSSLPLLSDFGMVVTINIAVALLSALVVVPPLAKEADRRGLLAMGPEAHLRGAGARSITGVIGGVALAIVGVVMVVQATGTDEVAAATPQRTASAEAPATIPPSTTVAPTTTLEVGDTLPPGPAERPSGLIAGVFYDTLTGVGVDPGVARCAADDLLAGTSEADLLAMGIADSPRPAEVNDLLDLAATNCGVTEEQLAAAAAGV